MEEIRQFSCDLDGILNNYPQCWLIYLADRCGTLYETVSLAKQNEIGYKQFKDEYRNSSYKATLPVLRKNRDSINSIISKGFQPVMVTSRPILDKKYPNLYKRTLEWLINSGVHFSSFEYKDPDACFIDKYPQIRFHIDDDPLYAKKLSQKGVKVYLLRNENWDFSAVVSDENIVIIDKLDEILNYESIF